MTAKGKDRMKHLLALTLFLALLGLGSLARAQAVPEPAPGAPEARVKPRETIHSLLMKGGWLMVPIGLCSVIVLTVAIERAISLRQARSTPPGLLAEIYSILPPAEPSREQQVDAADLLKETPSLLASILRAGILKTHRERATTERLLEEATAKEAHMLRRRLRPLSVIATLAPLMGLLGTVYGMITCFEQAAAIESASRAETLATGIYMALVTTAAGLTVALPSLVLYHYFQGRVERILDRIEDAANEFLEHYYGDPHDAAVEKEAAAAKKEELPPRQRPFPAAVAARAGEPS
jgi:biopolymer transport protein ExbB